MLVRYNTPTFVPRSSDTLYNNQEISYTAQQAKYLNWIKTVLEDSGYFTRVELRTDATTEDRLLPDIGNDDNSWYVPSSSTSSDTDLLKEYVYYVDCYIGENKFFSIYTKSYKQLNADKTRTIDGTTCKQVMIGDLFGFIIKPKYVDNPSYFSVFEGSSNSSVPTYTIGSLNYAGIMDLPSNLVIRSDYNLASCLVEIVQTDDAMFFRFTSKNLSSNYGLCLAKTFKGSIAAITSYSIYYINSRNNVSSGTKYPPLYCVSNESENYGAINSIPLFNIVEGTSTVLSYIPVSSDDDYVIGTYYTPLSQIVFDDDISSCSIRLAGNKYFYTGFFAAPYK